MKKALIVLVISLAWLSCIHAFKMANPTNHFDATLAYSQSFNPALQVQGTFNMNESFYVGLRFTAGSQVYYYSAVSRASDTAYLQDFSVIGLILGLQSGAFNERFSVFLNIIPGFGFGSRQAGTRTGGTMWEAGITGITKTEDKSFFAPAVEFGFNCMLTENLILSTGWQGTLIGIDDAPWEHYPWLVKLSETDALSFSIPVRLSWRF